MNDFILYGRYFVNFFVVRNSSYICVCLYPTVMDV